MLEKKIAESIAMLQEGERVALSLNTSDGYYLAFSGGKDSQVMLSIAKIAGVKFKAYYSVTSIDPPENVYFIRKHYPEVTFVHPKENFFKLVSKYGLPTMHKRFCCERIKEGLGAGNAVLTGVRAEESKKRAAYAEIEIFSRRKEHRGQPRQRNFTELMENEVQCIKGKDRLMVRPMLKWTEAEIWEYIEHFKLPVNPCYEKVGRVGCMFCPFATEKQMCQYEKEYPKIKEALLKSVKIFWDKYDQHELGTPEEYFEWWKSKQSLAKWRRSHSACPLND